MELKKKYNDSCFPCNYVIKDTLENVDTFNPKKRNITSYFCAATGHNVSTGGGFAIHDGPVPPGGIIDNTSTNNACPFVKE
jgi:hypothetical protein